MVPVWQITFVGGANHAQQKPPERGLRGRDPSPLHAARQTCGIWYGRVFCRSVAPSHRCRPFLHV